MTASPSAPPTDRCTSREPVDPLTEIERRVLWLIASLLGVVTAPPIGELLSGIDDRNVEVFLQAAAHLAGWHERGESTVVTGRIGP